MATCGSNSLLTCDTGNVLLTLFGSRQRLPSVSRIGSVNISDTRKIALKFKCAANSHNVSRSNANDAFLNLRPEISLLRGADPTDNNVTVGNVTQGLPNSDVANNYNEAKIKVIGVGGGGSNAVNRMSIKPCNNNNNNITLMPRLHR